MSGKSFAVNSVANIVYVILIVVALLGTELVYQIIGGYGDIVSSVVAMFIITVILFVPTAWILNKFLIKPDWNVTTFAKVAFKQNLILGIFLVFLILALISSSARNVDMAQPIMLLIITLFALASTKGTLAWIKNKTK